MPKVVWLDEGSVSQMDITPLLQILMENKMAQEQADSLKRLKVPELSQVDEKGGGDE